MATDNVQGPGGSKGYVLSGETHGTCGTPQPNSWVIQKVSNQAGEQINVCKDSPIPEGYVKTGVNFNNACPGKGDNAMYIKCVAK
jgi:hypothetical protein